MYADFFQKPKFLTPLKTQIFIYKQKCIVITFIPVMFRFIT